jgi:hypothetical protein
MELVSIPLSMLSLEINNEKIMWLKGFEAYLETQQVTPFSASAPPNHSILTCFYVNWAHII